jgi:hypothetical protein
MNEAIPLPKLLDRYLAEIVSQIAVKHLNQNSSAIAF